MPMNNQGPDAGQAAPCAQCGAPPAAHVGGRWPTASRMLHLWWAERSVRDRVILAIAGAIPLVIVLGVAVHKLTAQPNWYQNGYKFNETYLAEYGVLPAADFFWCGNAVDQQSEGGVP